MDKLPPPPPPPPPGRGRQSGPNPNHDRRQSEGADGQDGPSTPTWIRKWGPWIAMGVLLAVFIIPSLVAGDRGEELSYRDFISLVEDGSVERVDWENVTGKITGELSDGSTFQTTGSAD
ncbi:MAG: ATP-dependent metallopeptidase FtsH/Yme1/Tma family protein, partial [Ilumatobacteraceae bacterium]